MAESARSVASSALQRIEHEGAYANLVLPAMLSRSSLSDVDRRFVTELVYGTTRMRRACDAIVDRFVMNEPDAATRSLLRLGAYQLEFAKVAPHAAVSATVDLASRKTRGFVNAVLRKVAEESTETLLASKDGDKLHVVREIADLWFHSMVLLAWHGLNSDDVLAELERREGISGIDEKAARK